MKDKRLICRFGIALLAILALGCAPDEAENQPDSDDAGHEITHPSGLSDHARRSLRRPVDDPVDRTLGFFCGEGPALDRFRLTDGRLQLDFDARDGNVRQLADLEKHLQLLDETAPPDHKPFALFAIERGFFGGTDVQPVDVRWRRPTMRCEGRTLTVRWESPDGLVFEGAWTLAVDAPELRVTARVEGAGSRLLHRLRYPILAPLTPLVGDGAEDAYLTSLEGGMLLADPLTRLAEEVVEESEILRNHRFPIGHEAMAQMVAYLHEERGGLLVYTADGAFGAKNFSFTDLAEDIEDIEKRADSTPALYVAHVSDDVADGDGDDVFASDYPVVLRWLDTGRWTEAAEVYRQWSDQQVWASSPIAERPPAEREFFETAGASIFGLSGRTGQEPWIRAFHDVLVAGTDARLLFVLGWDFHPMGVPEPEKYFAFAQAGWDERFWRPFQPATVRSLEQIDAQDDFSMLFFYDLLAGGRVPGWDGYYPTEPGRRSYFDYTLRNPRGQPAGFTMYDSINRGMIYTLDPAHPYVGDFWRWRDRLLVAESPVPLTGLYYDLGFTVILRGDYRFTGTAYTGHTAGAGGFMNQAVRDILRYPRGTPNPRGFRAGAENTTEPFVDLIDFYHLGGSGLGPLRNKNEGSNPPVFSGSSRWVMQGLGRDVPLVAYLQHHNGATRTGGKMMASYRIGNVFYWNALAEYLWGGMVELIYFNTPVDWLPGMNAAEICPQQSEACAFQTSWWEDPQDPDTARGWYFDDEVARADPLKLGFLRGMIRLRVESAAAPYLTLGRMESPPRLLDAPGPVGFSYDSYASINGSRYNHAGVWEAEPIRVVAWRHPYDETVMVVLGNADATEHTVTLEIDPADYGFAAAELWSVGWDESEGFDEQVAVLTAPEAMSVTLPSRSVRLYELTP
jgi:hypothetical protein